MNQKAFINIVIAIIVGVDVIFGGTYAIAKRSGQQSNNSCTSQYTDTEHMDIFDSHAHIMKKVSASQIISEMNKAGVSVLNLYPIDGDNDSSSLEAISQYPGRFIAFVDTPDSPQLGTWLTQGQAFVDFAQQQLSTGKFSGIGKAIWNI